MVFCFVALGLVVIASFEPKLLPYKTFLYWAGMLTTAMGLLTHFWSMSLHWKLLQVRSKLRRFEEYENRIREKWGDDALEGFLQPPQQSN
jgi:hypothetical protein